MTVKRRWKRGEPGADRRCTTCGHHRYQHGIGCGGRGLRGEATCACYAFTTPLEEPPRCDPDCVHCAVWREGKPEEPSWSLLGAMPGLKTQAEIDAEVGFEGCPLACTTHGWMNPCPYCLGGTGKREGT